MSGHRCRWLGLVLLTSGSAGLLSLTSILHPAFAFGAPSVDVEPTVPFEVMEGSGVSVPTQSYIDYVQSLYFPSTALFDGQPTFPNVDPQGLTTPEQFYPVTGVNSESLEASVSQGVTILNNTIASGLEAGQPFDVFGLSQSSVIASLEMEELDPSGTPSDLPAQFVLVDDLMNPNGGIFERFAGLNIPSLGLDFYGATPADDFPTTVYTLEYDGYADFCQYPGDLLCDINAVIGMDTVHPEALDLTPAQLATGQLLPGSAALGADSLTNYYMIPTTDLPLLDPLREIPIVGNPLADLLQPDLTYLVNLGYGDPLYGWSTSAADEATTIGLFPSLSDVEMLPGLLVNGAQQGIEDFIGKLTGTSPNPETLASLDSLGSLLESSSGTTGSLTNPLSTLSTFIADPTLALDDLGEAISGVGSAVDNSLLPTADVIEALLTSIPAYDASLFSDNLSDPINALGLPIVADIGIGTVLGGLELDQLGTAILGIVTALVP